MGGMQGGKYASIGMGRQTEAYGAWYEGQQAKNFYALQSTLNMRRKEQKMRQIELQETEAELVRDRAIAASAIAKNQEGINKIREDKFQHETDTGISKMFSKMAKSGVAMNFGSPMNYIEDVVNERARDLELLKWEGRDEVWKKEMAAAEIHDKGAIMLYQAKVEESELPMFDYQSELFAAAGDEAERTAKWKEFGAYLGAFSDVFGGSSGGQQGGGYGSNSGSAQQYNVSGANTSVNSLDSYNMGGYNASESTYGAQGDFSGGESAGSFSGGGG